MHSCIGCNRAGQFNTDNTTSIEKAPVPLKPASGENAEQMIPSQDDKHMEESKVKELANGAADKEIVIERQYQSLWTIQNLLNNPLTVRKGFLYFH